MKQNDKNNNITGTEVSKHILHSLKYADHSTLPYITEDQNHRKTLDIERAISTAVITLADQKNIRDIKTLPNFHRGRNTYLLDTVDLSNHDFTANGISHVKVGSYPNIQGGNQASSFSITLELPPKSTSFNFGKSKFSSHIESNGGILLRNTKVDTIEIKGATRVDMTKMKAKNIEIGGSEIGKNAQVSQLNLSDITTQKLTLKSGPDVQHCQISGKINVLHIENMANFQNTSLDLSQVGNSAPVRDVGFYDDTKLIGADFNNIDFSNCKLQRCTLKEPKGNINRLLTQNNQLTDIAINDATKEVSRIMQPYKNLQGQSYSCQAQPMPEREAQRYNTEPTVEPPLAPTTTTTTTTTIPTTISSTPNHNPATPYITASGLSASVKSIEAQQQDNSTQPKKDTTSKIRSSSTIQAPKTPITTRQLSQPNIIRK